MKKLVVLVTQEGLGRVDPADRRLDQCAASMGSMVIVRPASQID